MHCKLVTHQRGFNAVVKTMNQNQQYLRVFVWPIILCIFLVCAASANAQEAAPPAPTNLPAPGASPTAETAPRATTEDRRERLEENRQQRTDNRLERQESREDQRALRASSTRVQPEERRAERAEQARARISTVLNRITQRLDSVLVRLNNITERIETRLDALEERTGSELTDARVAVARANDSLNQARTEVAELKNQTETALDTDNPRQSLAEIRTQVSAIKETLKAVRMHLRQAVVAVKTAINNLPQDMPNSQPEVRTPLNAPGLPGAPGEPGEAGADGENGEDGSDGQDGSSATN